MENEKEVETQMIPIVPALTMSGIINASISGIVSFIAVYFFTPVWKKIINWWNNKGKEDLK
jgi:hypothetical protein